MKGFPPFLWLKTWSSLYLECLDALWERGFPLTRSGRSYRLLRHPTPQPQFKYRHSDTSMTICLYTCIGIFTLNLLPWIFIVFAWALPHWIVYWRGGDNLRHCLDIAGSDLTNWLTVIALFVFRYIILCRSEIQVKI